MPLFHNSPLTGHAGGRLPFKIECDALTGADIQTLAAIIRRSITFSEVIGVPRGGVLIADALQAHSSTNGPTLLVDDVLTTGTSMEEARQQLQQKRRGVDVIGVVIFARGKCPPWIRSIFQLSEWAGP